MIKAIAFDYDGTLTDLPTGALIESGVKALNQCQKQGIKLILCTGRQAQYAPLIEGKLKTDYRVGCSGGQICDENLNTLVSFTISLETYDKINQYCLENQISLFWKFEDGCYFYTPQDDLVTSNKAIAEMQIRQIDGNDRLPISGSCFVNKKQVKDLVKKFSKEVQITDGGFHNVDFDVLGVNKATGLKKVAEIMGIQMDEIMAFGDGVNDIEMIKAAGIGVAMGSGVPPLKEAADYVTDSPKENGIYNALKHFWLIYE